MLGSSEYKCSSLPAGPASAYVGASLGLLMIGAVLEGGDEVGMVRGSGGTGGSTENDSRSFEPLESGLEYSTPGLSRGTLASE